MSSVSRHGNIFPGVNQFEMGDPLDRNTLQAALVVERLAVQKCEACKTHDEHLLHVLNRGDVGEQMSIENIIDKMKEWVCLNKIYFNELVMCERKRTGYNEKDFTDDWLAKMSAVDPSKTSFGNIDTTFLCVLSRTIDLDSVVLTSRAPPSRRGTAVWSTCAVTKPMAALTNMLRLANTATGFAVLEDVSRNSVIPDLVVPKQEVLCSLADIVRVCRNGEQEEGEEEAEEKVSETTDSELAPPWCVLLALVRLKVSYISPVTPTDKMAEAHILKRAGKNKVVLDKMVLELMEARKHRDLLKGDKEGESDMECTDDGCSVTDSDTSPETMDLLDNSTKEVSWAGKEWIETGIASEKKGYSTKEISAALHVCPSPDCRIHLKTRTLFLEHLAKEHPTYIWACHLCPLVLGSSSGLCRHKKSRHPTKSQFATFHRCKFDGCGYSAPAKYKLKEHLQTHGTLLKPVSELTCTECATVCKTATSLARHRRSAHQLSNATTLKCKWYYVAEEYGFAKPENKECPYTTYNNKNMSGHYKKVHMTIRCNSCLAEFKSNSAHKKHCTEVHSGGPKTEIIYNK